MMSNYIKTGNLQVAKVLFDFVNLEALPGTGLDREKFWNDLGQLVSDLAPKNKLLLEKRDEVQCKIDAWHRENEVIDFDSYKSFLEEINYLETPVEDFKITTENVDDVITVQAGPQLVVPIDNARYAINAANARWGSLYDALYGTDVIGEEDGLEKAGPYNTKRGDQVIAIAKDFLDKTVPLKDASHKDVVKYVINQEDLEVVLANNNTTKLVDPSKFVGYNGNAENPTAVLLKNNGLHIEIQIDADHTIGKQDKANVKDVYLESATTTIMDFEDSVAAVDAEDKTLAYHNWLGLIKGDLTSQFTKNGKEVTRTLNPD